MKTTIRKIKKHYDASFSDVEAFIDNQPITQIFRVKKHRNSRHITAFSPRESSNRYRGDG